MSLGTASGLFPRRPVDNGPGTIANPQLRSALAKPELLIFADERDQTALDLNTVRSENPGLVKRVRRFESH